MELTDILLPGGSLFYTFCLEAFGPDHIKTLGSLASFLEDRGIPPLSGGLILSYPEWIGNLE
jgi:hypothetical protein